MAFSKPNILIIGHSFVRRLEDDINSPYKPHFHLNFGLEQCSTYFVHEGGWKITLNYDSILREVQTICSTVPSHFAAAIIQLGGNDLCSNEFSPLEIASKLDDLALWLQQDRNIKVIYICELYTRLRPKFVSPDKYETRRTQTNMYLSTLLEHSNHVKLWRHRRIFHSPNNTFAKDGTEACCYSRNPRGSVDLAKRWDRRESQGHSSPDIRSAKKRRVATKATKTHVATTPETNESNTIDVEALTVQITKQVTESVLTTLQESGLLANKPTVTGAETTQAHKGDGHLSIQPQHCYSESSQSNSVNDLISSTSSSEKGENSIPNKQKFVSSRIPLHATVSLKKKEKIWSGDFIDLSTLQDDDVEDLTFNIRTGAVSSTTSSKKKFISIEQWTDAFNIFSSVYRLKYPAEAEGLSSYMGLIRQIADKNGSWYYYDTNFRRLKKSMNLAWSDIEHELFIIAMTKKQQPFRSGRDHDPNKRANNRVNKTRNHRSCDKFNKGTTCAGCSFPHVCAVCGKPNHPQFKCWSRNKTDGATDEQSNTKPYANEPKPAKAGQTTTTHNSTEVSTIKPKQQSTAGAASPAFATRELSEDIRLLLSSAVAPSTAATYRRAWKTFNDFSTIVYAQVLQPPIDVSVICAFIAYLQHKGYSPKTMSTFLSAISYSHKILDHPDPTSAFIVSKLIAGAYRIRPSFDTRFPITVAILDQIVRAVNHTTDGMYDQCLYKAMFLFAFNTFARIGELTSPGNNVLQLKDIIFEGEKLSHSVTVTFNNFKHNLCGKPHTISFYAGPSEISAVLALKNFLQKRGSQPGPLFCSVLNQPLPRSTFDSQLRRCLRFCNLDTKHYKGHSFRIGAATYRAEQGDSDAQIRALGRWKGNAFLQYIRSSNR